MAVCKAEAITNWLAQQARLEAMITQANSADLQTMGWFIKWLLARYNLGDFLNRLVSHDELHIDQAQRALAAYEQRAGVPDTPSLES